MQNGQRLGRYLLLEPIKSGGMAIVYRARDLDTDRVVAIKVLSQTLARDPAYVQRFKNEVAQVRKLAHPNIVPIEFFGAEGPYTYFVMPLYKASLRDALMRYQRLAPDSALTIAIQIASALTAVHALGMIHRDIKPDNILLSDDRALLTDFGIVRQIEFAGSGSPTLAGTGLPIGTPQYMPPELLSSQQVDQRADLYALGAVLYEMLTGQAPHNGDTPYSIASRVLSNRIQPPASLNPAIPAILSAVVMRALAPNPADRYPDAANLRTALQGVYMTLQRDKMPSRRGANEHAAKAPPPPYPPMPGAAAAARGAGNLPPLSYAESAPPPAIPPFVQPDANAATRGDSDRGGGYGNGQGSAGGNRRGNRPAHDDDRRRFPQPVLLVALGVVLLLIALFSGLNLVVNIMTHGEVQPTATTFGQPPPTRPPPPPPGGPPVRVTPQTASYPCNGSVDTTLTLINDGRDAFPWSGEPLGPNGAGVTLDISNGTLAPGERTRVHVIGRPTGNTFDVRFLSDGGNPTVHFTCI